MEKPGSSSDLVLFRWMWASLVVCLLLVLLQHSQTAFAARKKAAKPPHNAVIEPRVQAVDVAGIQLLAGASAGTSSSANSKKSASKAGKKLKRLRPPRLGEAIELRVTDAGGREQVIKGHRLHGPRHSKVMAGEANSGSGAQRTASSARVIRIQVQ